MANLAETPRTDPADQPLLVEICVPEDDPNTVADEAGLRYVHDSDPGIRRRRRGKGFTYIDARGRPVTSPRTLERIRKLGIPPAWTEVWICADPLGHIQATGLDARGRKQYRYHDRWRAVRDENKFGRMLAFGLALPGIRARVEEDLAKRGLSREKVLATVVRLLDTTFIRVGNDKYARANESFGLTTLRDEHAVIDGAEVRLEFRAKSGKMQSVSLRDRRLARIIKACQDLPGQELFGFVDESGNPRDVGSADVNAYLQEISGQSFTAKDFRTWAGTVLAVSALQDAEHGDSPTAAKRVVTAAVKAVAQRLNNTPTVCRKCYIHPKVIEHFMGGTLRSLLQHPTPDSEAPTAHSPEERAVLAMLSVLADEDGEPRPA